MNPAYRLIEGPYLRDLLQQPDAIWETSQSLAELDLGDLPGQLRYGAFDRVILTGMGSSLHALHVLPPLLAATSTPVLTLETAELVHTHPHQLTGKSLVIGVSQSGASAEMLRLLPLIPQGAHLVAITNTPDSPLAQAAHTRLITQAGDECCVACKTYIASVAALLWLGSTLAGAPPAPTAQIFGRAAEAAADYLSWWRDHVEQIAGILSETRHLFITGRGASLAAACTAGLTLKEAARFPAEGLSSAAFRHGPIETTGPDTAILVLEGTPATASMNSGLHKDLLALNANAQLIGKHAESAAYKLPDLDDLHLPLLEILPCHLTALALAALGGFEAGRFLHATKITTVE